MNKVRPVPKAVAEKGWEVDDEGKGEEGEEVGAAYGGGWVGAGGRV